MNIQEKHEQLSELRDNIADDNVADLNDHEITVEGTGQEEVPEHVPLLFVDVNLGGVDG